MPSAEYVLPVEDPADFVSTTHGRPVTYRHHDGGVAVISGEAERSIAFSDVTHVRLARLGMMHICELRLRDGDHGGAIVGRRARLVGRGL